MEEIAIWIISIIVVVSAVSMIYHLLPARTPGKEKPGFVLFPKYQFNISDPVTFPGKLEKLGFSKIENNRYSRGNSLGDFSAKWIKLNIRISSDSKFATLASPVLGILFDTGDLWKITNQLTENN